MSIALASPLFAMAPSSRLTYLHVNRVGAATIFGNTETTIDISHVNRTRAAIVRALAETTIDITYINRGYQTMSGGETYSDIAVAAAVRSF